MTQPSATQQATAQKPKTNTLKLAGSLFTRLLNDYLFLATVAAVTGNTAQVTRAGQSAPDGTSYVCALGLAGSLTVGDTVAVLKLGASYAVVAKLTNSATAAVALAGTPVTINAGVNENTSINTGSSTGTLALGGSAATVEVGSATTSKVGFYGTTAITQRTSASQAAVATTAATTTTPWGYTTQAQANAIVTLVNELRASLVASGLIKGS